MKPPLPSCPACGSSATLPFENGDGESGEQPVAEILLSVLLFFLSLLVILLFFLLSRASLPAAILAVMTAFLFARRQRQKRRRARSRPQAYVCLDCSRNFWS